MALKIVLNGHERVFEELEDSSTISQVVSTMELKADRIAIEHNGRIAPRTAWGEIKLADGDCLELVHFVGGGTESELLG